MRPIEEFNWGWMDIPTNITHISHDGSEMPLNEYHRQGTIKELFEDKVYERFFSVEEGDIVLDIGASLGPFTFSILHKKPKHVYAVEPSESEFKVLVQNTLGYPVTPILKGISSENTIVENDMLFGGESHMEGMTFNRLIDLYNLHQIDFFKIDCEGGEYEIFTEENFEFFRNNVKKIAGEWHLKKPEEKQKFRKFRDFYLSKFSNHQVYSYDGVDIKWDLWNDSFIEYYNEIIIYIDNR